MKKRGISHIEIILSFFIFISFILFALYFFNPTNTTRLADSSLEYAITEIKNNLSIDIDSYSIILDSVSSSDYNKAIDIKIVGVDTNKEVMVLDKNGRAVSSDRIDPQTVRLNLTASLFGSGGGAEIVMDNADTGFSTHGSWPASSASGYWGTNSSYSSTAGNNATWAFNSLDPGNYQVYAWWTYHSLRPDDAPYHIYNGNTEIDEVRVDQQDNTLNSTWNLLGTYDITTVLKVRLYAGGGNSTNADAIKIIKMGSGSGEIPKILFAEDFDASPSPTTNIINTEYKISSSEKLKVISEKRLLKLNETYYANYDTFKEEFNLPKRVGVGFSVLYDSGRLIDAQKNVQQGVEVFTKSERIQVLNLGGNIENAELTVKVW